MKKFYEFLEQCNEYMNSLQKHENAKRILKNCGIMIFGFVSIASALISTPIEFFKIVASELYLIAATLFLLSVIFIMWFYCTKFINNLIDKKKL